jgi:predicted lipoprotein with Yx(FWY)xxD motif
MKRVISALGAMLMLAACGGTTASTGTGSSPSGSGEVLIHTQAIKVGDKTETVLKNLKGLTLYYLTADSATTTNCTGGCATNWPPLTATSDNPASDPALPGSLSVRNGPNGKQVLYNGHPLYRYAQDSTSSDALGQGIGGKWFVATPDLARAAAPSPSRYTY